MFSINCFVLDKATLTSEIDKLQDGLKPKVEELNKLEGVTNIIHVSGVVNSTPASVCVQYSYYGTTQCHAGRAETKGFGLKGMTIEEILSTGQ